MSEKITKDNPIERSEIMRMVMIIYNEALDAEIMEILTKCALKNYTKIMGTFGKGNTSGTHLGDDIWPGRNNVLYVACLAEEAKQLIGYIKEMRKSLGQEGIKAFILPLEELT
ncbi:MAG: PG0541 family transporter-associated protein [Candidatus Omnitrophota bacterium]